MDYVTGVWQTGRHTNAHRCQCHSACLSLTSRLLFSTNDHNYRCNNSARQPPPSSRCYYYLMVSRATSTLHPPSRRHAQPPSDHRRPTLSTLDLCLFCSSQGGVHSRRQPSQRPVYDVYVDCTSQTKRRQNGCHAAGICRHTSTPRVDLCIDCL